MARPPGQEQGRGPPPHNNGGRHGHSMSLVIQGPCREDLNIERYSSLNDLPNTPDRNFNDHHELTSSDRTPMFGSSGGSSAHPSLPQPKEKDIVQMKKRFAKLLLGEDMSGRGNGVSSALALSNAITDLSAHVFGKHWKLEPLSPGQKARWKKEMNWLFSVSDYIVEFAPCQQTAKDGTCMEIMKTKQRSDLQVNLPALRKLDAMLLDCLDNFKDQSEFFYVTDEPTKHSKRKDEKWWLPRVQVPPNGLSEVMKRWVQFQKDSVNQVLKAAVAINAEALLEMEIPETYIESLPKNGRSSLGDSIYKSITEEYFDPEQFLSSIDLSSDQKIVDLENRIEASIVIWNRKMTGKDSKSPWGSAVSLERREVFEDRAETVLLILKQQFPGIPQSSLETSKIQHNKDIGRALREGYSRVLERLAHKVLSQIEDVLHANTVAQNPTSRAPSKRASLRILGSMKFPNAKEEVERLNAADTPTSMTLMDFMGWSLNHEDGEVKKGSDDNVEEVTKDVDLNSSMLKLKIETPRKFSYIERLEIAGGARSPTARH